MNSNLTTVTSLSKIFGVNKAKLFKIIKAANIEVIYHTDNKHYASASKVEKAVRQHFKYTTNTVAKRLGMSQVWVQKQLSKGTVRDFIKVGAKKSRAYLSEQAVKTLEASIKPSNNTLVNPVATSKVSTPMPAGLMTYEELLAKIEQDLKDKYLLIVKNSSDRYIPETTEDALDLEKKLDVVRILNDKFNNRDITWYNAKKFSGHLLSQYKKTKGADPEIKCVRKRNGDRRPVYCYDPVADKKIIDTAVDSFDFYMPNKDKQA